MTQGRESIRYAIRRTPEPFDIFDRWEVIELNHWRFLPDPHRRVSNHFTRRKALKVLRRLEYNQAHPETISSARVPLADLRAHDGAI